MKKIILILLLITVSACSYNRTSGGDAQQNPGGFHDPNGSIDDQVVRFADVKSQVFDTSCTACHVRKGLELSFADHANVVNFAVEIKDRVFAEQDMPPTSQLTGLQQLILKTWLDNGAPE